MESPSRYTKLRWYDVLPPVILQPLVAPMGRQILRDSGPEEEAILEQLVKLRSQPHPRLEYWQALGTVFKFNFRLEAPFKFAFETSLSSDGGGALNIDTDFEGREEEEEEEDGHIPQGGATVMEGKTTRRREYSQFMTDYIVVAMELASYYEGQLRDRMRAWCILHHTCSLIRTYLMENQRMAAQRKRNFDEAMAAITSRGNSMIF